MDTIFSVETLLETTVCGKCGAVFAMAQAMMNERKGNHQPFYCPNGHERSFPQEAEAEKLQRRLKKEETSLFFMTAERNEAIRREKNLKSQVTKLKNKLKK